MTTARRPGRVQKIAFDATPLDSPRPDVDARIGWLLAMSRLHHPCRELGDGSRFVQALEGAGFVASRSLVSRWEAGEIPISYEATSAYERALELEPGRISSLTGYVRAAIPGVSARVVRPQLDPSSPGFSRRLDELIERAEDGAADAGDWQDLGWHLAAAPLVHLRASTWETLAERLVGILPRSVKVPYRKYSTAAMNIASVPRARDFLTDAVLRHVRTPGVQVLTTPIGLLDQIPTREAARVVLDMIEEPDAAVFSPAVWVATQKVRRGDFTAEERTRLDMTVLRLWRTDPVRTSDDLAQLIASLSPGMRSTLAAAAAKAGRCRLGEVIERAEDLDPDESHRLCQDIAEGARRQVPQQPTYVEDRMLGRLVREGLCHRDSERRHLASLLIAASPFGQAVADELLSLLASPGIPTLVRARAATLARYLGDDTHRLRMLRFVDDADDHVSAALVQGIGHMGFTEFSDQAIRSGLQQAWSPREQAKMYALGMTGSPSLSGIARSRHSPQWQRVAAQWWLAQGPAVRC